ncbi:MAG: hypothetical protein H8E24_00735, partial [Verrucomicrobia bacterium]|nr:hypothetical protein [Verrucomicrobiota bacterium]
MGLFFLVFSVAAAEPVEEIQEAWGKGDYAVVVTKTAEAIKENEWKEDLWILQIRGLMAQGKYEDALKTTSAAIEKVSRGVRVRLLAEEVFRYNGDSKRADAVLVDINQLAGSRAWAYRNAPDLVTLGRTALKLGGAAKLVLGNLYAGARESDAEYVVFPPSIVELALATSGFAVA